MKTVHAKVPGIAVVNSRLVADREVQVVVDGVPERESDAQAVELLPRDAVDAGFAAVVPGAVDRPQKCSVKSRVKWASTWNIGSVFNVCPT